MVAGRCRLAGVLYMEEARRLWRCGVQDCNTAGVPGLEDRPCALEMGIGLEGLTASVSSVYSHTATSTWLFGQNLGSAPDLVSGL